MFLIASGSALGQPNECPTFVSAVDLPSEPARRGSHLLHHWLLVPANCKGLASHLSMLEEALRPRRVAAVSGELAVDLGLLGCPAAACLERGAPAGSAQLVAAGARSWQGQGFSGEGEWGEELLEWTLDVCQKVEFGFVNLGDRPFTLRWLHPGRPGPSDVSIEPGGWNETVTFYRRDVWFTESLGEPFLVLDPDGAVYLYGAVEYAGVYPLGDSPDFDPNLYERDWDSLWNQTREIEILRAERIHVAFTKSGSQAASVPLNVWASVAAYYHNNRQPLLREWRKAARP